MSSIFKPVTLKWRGTDYVIEPTRVMRAIAIVEDYVTLHELAVMTEERHTIKTSRIAMAYAALLQYAGAKDATEETVYLGMFRGNENSQQLVASSITGLLTMLIPHTLEEGQSATGEQSPNRAERRKRKRASGSSSSGSTTRLSLVKEG